MSTNNIPEGYTDHVLSEQEFLDVELSMGIGFHNPGFINLCNNTAEVIKLIPDVKTVLDYGAGTGVYARAYHNLGYDVTVVEKFLPHREYINKEAPELTKVWSLEDLEANGPVKVDLLSWIEVAEHQTDEEIDHVLKLIRPKFIYFSSTSELTPNDAAWGHINVKAQTDWVNIFKKKGFKLLASPNLPTSWAKIFIDNDTYNRPNRGRK